MNNVVKQGILKLILIFFWSTHLQAGLYAEIDREQVSIGERFYLTLEVEGEHTNLPDLSNLRDSFRISPAQRSVLTTHKTGQRAVKTRWQIALRAIHPGRIEISALTFNDQTSSPLYVSVSEKTHLQATPNWPHFEHDLSINVSTDKEVVYRNAQLLVNLDIFHKQPLPEATDFIPPQIEAGRVYTLDLPHTRKNNLNGEEFFQTRLRFAVFPDEVGFVEISGPGLRFPEPNHFSVSELYTDMPDIEVLAPAKTGSEQNWLPSNNLLMSDITHILEGHHNHQLIRQVLLTAVGTRLDRLPTRLLDTAQAPHYELLNREAEEHYSSQGITSRIFESWLIRSTEQGLLEHPPSEIFWWDTLSEQNRYTQPQQPEAGQHLLNTSNNPYSEPHITEGYGATETISPQKSAQTWLLPVLLGFGTLLLLSSAFALYRRGQVKLNTQPLFQAKTSQPRFPAQSAKHQMPPAINAIKPASKFQQAAERSELQAFLHLSKACQHNAGQQAHSAFILWAACFWPDKHIINIESIYQAKVSQTLNYLLLDLEHHLKRPNEGCWQGDLLLEAVTTLRKRRNLQ